MKKIPIFKAEREAGIADMLQSQASVAYLSPVLIDKTPNKELTLSLAAIKNRTQAVNQNQIDLYYIKDILASTGWNLNDDVFSVYQTWSARNTAEDKRFNLGHNQKEIIGHMTSQYCIDTEGKVLAQDLTVDELPEKFHIVSTSVIYLYWPEKEYRDKIANIVAEIENQTEDKPKWFVSMEALFDDFDYAVIDKQGKQTVVARDEKSAFLTKHLRAYGGKGSYQDYKVGRLLKNIVFSGKGLVENPANPESVIFNDTTPFKASAKEINFELSNNLGYTLNSNIFSKENDSMNEKELALQKQLDEARAAQAAAEKSKQELEKRLTDEINKSVQTKVDELNKSVEAANAKVATLEKDLQAKANEVVELNKKLVDVSEKFAKASTELQNIENEKRVAARKNRLIDECGLETSVAESLVETLSVLSDEAFAKYVEKSPKKQAPATVEVSEKDKAAAATAALNNATPNKDTTSVAASTANDIQATRKKIAEAYNSSKASKKKVEASEK
jgi:hypothetical protein